jgi:hypothetical protein
MPPKGFWFIECAHQFADMLLVSVDRTTLAPVPYRRHFPLLEEDDTDVVLRQDAQEPGRIAEEKIRKCLVCRSPFPSAWAGERVCRRCKTSSAWRSGALK